jgi:hypothetical protein
MFAIPLRCDTFAIPLRCDSHACEILLNHLLCLRYFCDVNCIAKIGIWRFGVLGCDSRYDGICFAKFQYAKVCTSQKWSET